MFKRFASVNFVQAVIPVRYVTMLTDLQTVHYATSDVRMTTGKV